MVKATTRDDKKNAAALEREIDDTRADVRATLDALEQKLSPGELLDHLMTLARRHGGGIADSLGTAAKDNPVATLLAAVGLAWLFSAARPASEMPPIATPPGRATARRALRHRAGPSGPLATARSKLDQVIFEQPLLVGAVGVAVGALLSVALGPRFGERGSSTAVEDPLEQDRNSDTV